MKTLMIYSTYERGKNEKIYQPEMNEKVYRFSLLGMTEKEMAEFFDIAESTFWDWKRRYPEFNEALKKGKEVADSRVAESLYQRAIGYHHKDVDIRVVDGQIIQTPIEKHYPPETSAAIFWLKNRSRAREIPWIESARTELTGKDGTPIQTLNLSRIMERLSDTELALLEKLAKESGALPLSDKDQLSEFQSESDFPLGSESISDNLDNE
jgi:hypothetical protein